MSKKKNDYDFVCFNPIDEQEKVTKMSTKKYAIVKNN